MRPGTSDPVHVYRPKKTREKTEEALGVRHFRRIDKERIRQLEEIPAQGQQGQCMLEGVEV